MTALDRVPCPRCGRCEATVAPVVWEVADGGSGLTVWPCKTECPCGAQPDFEEADPTLAAVLREASTVPEVVDHKGCGFYDLPPARFAGAVLRGLGLTDADILALAEGARLRVERGGK